MKKLSHMSKYPVLTYNMLASFNPCYDQRREFKKLFPHGALITPENAEKAGETLRIGWAARILLTEQAYACYQRLMLKPDAEYSRATARWFKTPWEARDKARKLYEAARLKHTQARGRAFARAAMKDKA